MKTTDNNDLQFKAHILLADDEEYLVKLWRRVLQAQGYKVTCCLNGKEALELFRVDPGGYNIILTDQTMPEMKGHELAREIKKIRPDIRIILVSGHLEDIDYMNSAQNGIDEIIAKPFSIYMLLEVILRNL